jgi:hypothetical protein
MASKPPLISDELKALATSEHLYAIVILDKNGNVAFQSSPVSLQLSSLAKDLVSGRREAVVHLFGGIGESGADGPADFVGIRRQGGNGAALLLGLSERMLRYKLKNSRSAACLPESMSISGPW